MDIAKPENLLNTSDLVAIEYPAKVESIEKVNETFGGIEELSKNIGDGQKLQLRLGNIFVTKPIISSEPSSSSGILLKVKVRRSKSNPSKSPEFSSEIVGHVGTTYKFNNMGDYQYLPVMKNEKTGKTECIYDQIIPNDITAGPSWFRENKNALSFLPPLAFTRTDTPQYNVLKNDSKETDESVQQTNFSSSYRVVRSSYGIAIPFDYKPAPSKPNEKAKIVEDDELFDELKKMFEKQPVWTSTSLRAHVRNLKKRTITHYLASIAYAFTTGPWRNCFVRFGYDPRDNFDSRFYQILDFRIRRFAGSRVDIKTKRQYVSSQKRLKVPVKDEGNEEDDVEKDYQTRKNYAIFTLDTVPPSKAIHYMLIDIRVEQIQEMLINLAHSSSIICDEKRGWLPVGFMDKCRDIMTSIALENIIKLSKDKNISFDLKSDCTENPSEMLDDSSENETFDDIEMNENEV